jgi:E3 ubiquitin-protein ligase AMFR
MLQVVLWVSWFSVLGFLSLLSQLSKDRFEYVSSFYVMLEVEVNHLCLNLFSQLSFSPTTPGWSHFRLVILLSVILLVSGLMFIIAVGVGLYSGINTFSFMAAEVSKVLP